MIRYTNNYKKSTLKPTTEEVHVPTIQYRMHYTISQHRFRDLFINIHIHISADLFIII